MDAISCLAPPPALLPSSSYTADAAAIARALHFSTTMSMSSDSSSSSSPLSHHHSPLLLSAALPSPYYALPPPSHLLVADDDSGSPPRRRRSPPTTAGRRQNQNHLHQQHSHANTLLAPAGGRVGKQQRRSRVSKRAPTTYISTDPANFRLMVQQITGVQAADLLGAGDASVSGVNEMMMLQVQEATTALLGADAAGNPQLLLPPAGDDEASASASALALRHQQHQLQLQLQQPPCFPTLDSSWNVMYESNTNSAEML